MPDTALTVLLTLDTDRPEPVLWFADEQFRGVDPAPLRRPGCRVISNRYDIRRDLVAAGVDAAFSDFETDDLPPAGLRRVCYRVSKEKPVVHHLINSAWRLLAPGGELWLAGARNEGIRTYLDKAGALFGGRAELRKRGGAYLGRLVRTDAPPGPAPDDRDYPRLRPIATLDGVELLAKPGLFGWDKIDRGSALLAERLPAWLERCPQPPRTLLDLGCGYGYLAVMANRHGIERIVATDNNAAALIACRANFAARRIRGAVVAGDCGDTLEERFDALLCNPPFHQGFAPERGLTERFLAAAARLVASRGRALFVVNRFIPLERLAGAHFRQITPCADDPGFRVFELARPHS